MMRIRSSLFVLCLSCLGAAAGADQSTLPAFVEHVEVQQVNLEVFVTSPEGRSVDDLAARDFTVYEDGKPVPVQSFSRMSGPGSRAESRAASRSPSPAIAGTPAGEAGAPVYLVVFLDELHMGSANREPVFAALTKTLGERLPRGAHVMVARFENGMQVLVPFTAELDKVRQTLEAAALRPSPRQLLGDEDRLQTLDSIQMDFHEGPCLFGEQLARAYSQRKRNEVLDTVAALDRLVGTLDGLPGRKAVLYVSNGVPLQPGQEAWDSYLELCGGGGMSRGAAASTDTSEYGTVRYHRPDPQKLRLEALSFDTSNRWQALAARANGQGVSLYSLIPEGPAARTGAINSLEGGTPSAVTLSDAGFDKTDALFLLSTETGAQILHSGAALEQRIGDMVDDLGRYYLLGYTAPDPESPRVHQLRVEVSRPGVTLRHRRSYAFKSREQQATDRLLTRLYYAVGDNPLDLGLAMAAPTAVPVGPSKEAKSRPEERVRLRVPLRRLTLLNENGTARGAMTVYLVSRDEAGNVTPVRRRAIPLTVPAGELAAAPNRDFVYEVAISLPKGRNDVAVAVRDELSGEISFQRETFTIKK